MPTVRTGPLIGLTAQIVLLGALAATVGLTGPGWLVGVGYGLVTCVALSRGLGRAGAVRLGPADRVTLTRAVLAGGVTALVVDAAIGRPTPVGLLTTLTVVALLLDAVDGRVARRTGTASALGARFDMEADAFLLLVLSVHVAPNAGGWVLAIGGMRYAFVVAGWALPWLRATLPARQWRKVAAAAQGIVLAVALAGVLPHRWATLLVAGGLALLVESFARDVFWLWRHRPLRPRPRPTGHVAGVVPVQLVAERVRVLPGGATARPPALAVGAARADEWGR
ncbi:CDP-alcohol phosphatidyltransferase family protein [Micromonospora sp. NPDC051006]|uniref:CDP-alcohol phosphatidyltransferase family protein n=1 Tax=Micromonospora sp. NPDC051006 TaxID=3364283 RepID=UPI0037B4E5B9